MSSKLISFRHRRAGVPTDVTAARLSDATGTFGVRRVSDGVVVVPNDTALAQDGTGLYSYEVTGLDAGVAYEYSLEWVFNGATKREERTFTMSAATASWFYADQQAVVDLIAEENLTIISDLDPTTIELDLARIQRGGNWSDAYIDAALDAAVYQVPLTGMSAGTALLLRDASARLVAWWLYQNRGIRDVDPTKPPEGVAGFFNNHRKIADGMLRGIFDGSRKVTADRLGAATRPVSIVGRRRGLSPCACVPDDAYFTLVP